MCGPCKFLLSGARGVGWFEGLRHVTKWLSVGSEWIQRGALKKMNMTSLHPFSRLHSFWKNGSNCPMVYTKNCQIPSSFGHITWNTPLLGPLTLSYTPKHLLAHPHPFWISPVKVPLCGNHWSTHQIVVEKEVSDELSLQE